MNDAESIKHKLALISIYKKNLQLLEVRQAESNFDLSIVNQIDNIKNMINQLEEDINDLSSTASLSSSYSFRPIPFPLQKYENFITRFAEELSGWNGDESRYKRSVLSSLKQAGGASNVFTTRYIDGDWSILSDAGEGSEDINSLVKQAGPFREILASSQKRTDLTIGVLNKTGKVCLMLPLGNEITPEILVFFDADSSFDYDKGLELILQTIAKQTQGLSKAVVAEQLEIVIYNALRKNFGYVSDAMYNRQFYLFNRKLESMTVHFEPIIFLSPTAPSIYGWEALAREPNTLKAPIDLLETAELWGVRYQLQLDMYFLKRAIGIYITDPSDPNGKKIRRKHTIQPLSVNVHPTSLLRTRYYETFKKIEQQGFMPLNKVYLEISEKAPIPLVDNWDGEQNPIDAFREFLFRFRDLDVHFSVDDFGVGFASSSRISRLGPAFVKVDRDALLDHFGNFTLEYVIRLARRMPGEMGVIIEGYDDESKFSLRRLYELGARYIQGYKYGPTRPAIDDRLPANIVQDIRHALEGCS